jgi:hypothetical protein
MPPIGTEEEALLLNDNLFLVKQELTRQLSELLGDCSNAIRKDLEINPGRVPAEALQSTPKISKGENYLGRPWMILDYPRVFSKEDMFAFRTLCWWGQGFSMTLLLKGRYLDQLLGSLIVNAPILSNGGFRVGVAGDPFIHDFTQENIRSLEQFPEPGKAIGGLAAEHGFIKLVKLLPLELHHQLVSETENTWKLLRDAF